MPVISELRRLEQKDPQEAYIGCFKLQVSLINLIRSYLQKKKKRERTMANDTVFGYHAQVLGSSPSTIQNKKMCRWKKFWTSILLHSSVFLNSKLIKMASMLYSFKEHEID